MSSRLDNAVARAYDGCDGVARACSGTRDTCPTRTISYAQRVSAPQSGFPTSPAAVAAWDDPVELRTAVNPVMQAAVALGRAIGSRVVEAQVVIAAVMGTAVVDE